MFLTNIRKKATNRVNYNQKTKRNREKINSIRIKLYDSFN